MPARWSSLIRASAVIAFVAKLGSGPASGAVPMVWNQSGTYAPNPWRAEINYVLTGATNWGLFSFDPNSDFTNLTYTLLSLPANGILEYRSDLLNGGFQPVPLNTPISNDTWKTVIPKAVNINTINNRFWTYTATNNLMASPGAADTFTWKTTNRDGDSAAVTCTVRIVTNRAPAANDLYRTCTPGTDTTFAVDGFDPDMQTWQTTLPRGQTWRAMVITPPLHGTIVASNGLFLTYRPTPGTTQRCDRFTYVVNDTVEDSPPATATLQLRAATDRASNMVILVVNQALLQTALSNEIYRLKADLEHEGYASKLRSWNMATEGLPSNVWAYLRGEYTNANPFLAGAILIGSLPKAFVTNASRVNYTDLVYWNLQYFQTARADNPPHNIWVSRIVWPGSEGNSGVYGDEYTLLKRALDANHAYRTGASRLPHTAYDFCVSKFYGLAADSNNHTRLKDIWPDAGHRAGWPHGDMSFLPARPELSAYAGADCLAAGGEIFESVSDGAAAGFMDSSIDPGGGGWMDVTGLYRTINQIRFQFLWACDCGSYYNGLAENMLCTRGGGCVLAVAGTGTGKGGKGVGEMLVSEPTLTDACFRQLVKAGESMGNAAVQYYAFNTTYNDLTMFYGDLSLGAMAAPSNSLPEIRSFTQAIPPGHAPVMVTFAVDAYDPDGTISNIEWFLTGYDGGRIAPTCSGTGTNAVFAYPGPGVYTCRVEVVDNYRARTWREAVLTLAAASTCTVTVAATGPGTTSWGGSPVSRMLPVGATTQIVYTAADWYRIQTLLTNGLAAGAAAGTSVYTQLLQNVAADVSNSVTFDLATPAQTGYTNVPTVWLTNWAEHAIVSDPAFDVYGKYLAGLDPTTLNTLTLTIESLGVAGSNILLTLRRRHTGGLSPDGIHGQLELEAGNAVGTGFTNVPDTAVTGPTAFDDAGRRTFTNTIESAGRFFRAVIH